LAVAVAVEVMREAAVEVAAFLKIQTLQLRQILL
jgi:hypothetical protein